MCCFWMQNLITYSAVDVYSRFNFGVKAIWLTAVSKKTMLFPHITR